jgi:hypothetical protein
MNFANESACLTVDNIRNEVATIHISQSVENAVPLHIDIFCCYFVKKNTGTAILLAFTAHKTPTFIGWSGASRVRCGFCELQ